MKAEELGRSRVLNLLFKPAGFLMGSTARRWLSNPVEKLRAADLRPGQTVLEVGCGTGFFTIPAARMLGERGLLVAMDVSTGFLDEVSRKLRDSGLKNVRIVRRDALDTGLDAESMDKVLLFGVIPFPLLPLSRLLPEMHRVLKPDGTLAVWLFPPAVHFWVPRAIRRSGLFAPSGRRHGVYGYQRR